MHRPPELTKREMTLVPLLVEGATRKEIAEQLSISEETVKAHVRSILQKFGVSTLREGFVDLQQFNEFYITDYNDGHEFNRSLTSELIIAADRRHATNILKAEVDVVYGEVKSTIFACGIDAGEIISAEMYGRPVKETTRLDNRNWYEFVFEEPIKKGGQYTRSLVLKTRDAYLKETEFQLLNIFRPTAFASIRVTFEDKLVPKAAKVVTMHQGRLTGDTSLKLKRSGNSLYLDIPDPKVYHSYAIEWVWDAPSNPKS